MALRLVLVVEELLTNVVAYGAPRGTPLELTLAGDASSVELTFEDAGTAFDPTSVPVPELEPDAARTPGGLGIHLVRRLMDEVFYARVGDRNKLVMRRHL